ncbi:MAG: cyclic nucleotide-binding domain-containing protein [Pseudomonadota bacterium]
MSNPDLIAMAMDAMVAINAAIRNIRLYPAGSAMVKKSIERVLPPMNAVLEQQGSLSYAESEKALLVFNEPLSEKELKKPQAASFIELLLDFGIRDITFRRGVSTAELEALFSLLSQKPEDISAQGGLHRLVQSAALRHILLDHKVYVALAKDQVITSSGQPEEQARKAMSDGETPTDGSGSDSRVQQLAAAPRDLAEAIHGGIASLSEQGEGAPGSGLSETLGQILSMLDNHGDSQEKESLGKEVATALAKMAPDALARILASDVPGIQTSSVLTELGELLEEDAFSAVAARLQVSPPGRTTAGQAEAAAGTGSLSVYDNLMRTDKGQRLQARVDALGIVEKQAQTVRLKAGIGRIMSGDIAPLNDPELAQAIPRTVVQLMGKGKQHTATTMMERLQQGLRSNDAATRASAAAVMAETGSGLVAQGYGDAAEGVAVDLVRWLKTESAVIPALEDVYTKLQRLAQTLLRQGAYRQANRFLTPLSRIKRGEIPKEPSVQTICDMALSNIADKETLDLLLAGCWNEEGACDPEAMKSLQLLCPYSAAYLLDALAETVDRSQRIRILRLYPDLGDFGVAELAERISSGGPWYYLRNLVTLIGKMGKPVHIDHLEPLLHHSEPRLQREVLNAIYAIGDDLRGTVLTRYLPSADDQIKASVIALLGALKHAPAIRPLVDLLDSKAAISSKFKDPIQVKVCQALGAIGAVEAEPALTTIVTQKGVLLKAYATSVQEAAKKALAAIKKAQAGDTAAKPAAPRPPAAPPTPAPATSKAAPDNDTREKEVDALVAAGKTEAAVKLLFELIVAQAKLKNFARAEALRDKLMAVDDMALMEIVKAAEIIEEEKSAALDGGHAELWKNLYDILSSEEVNALFYGMETVDFATDAVILKQDQINDRLFFINKGKVKAIYRAEENESLLRTYEKGEVIGLDSFFDIKVCTTSLVAETPVTAMVLTRSTLAVWKETQPALEPKLVNYFLKYVKEYDLLKKAGLNRRRSDRIKIDGKLLIQIVDAKNTPIGKPFKGDLSDLSASGLSFFIKTSKTETARMLLGRRFRMAFAIPGGDAPIKINQTGTVLSVNYLLHTDYSVHVRFIEQLKDSEITALEKLKTE